MARKVLKRESTKAATPGSSVAIRAGSAHQNIPVLSGDTIVIDNDSENTIVDGPVDEGYQTNLENKNDLTRKSLQSSDVAGNAPDSAESGLQVLGRGLKELVHVVQDLRHLGVEDLVLPLPKIVVVGDQSTGKSSLIEGISEIKVPRAAGTCTRCPMEINLSESSSPWVCKVSLHKKYVYEGHINTSRPLGKATSRSEGATRARPLGPWALQDPEDFVFSEVRCKQDVAHTLYLAQLATLNPGSPYEKFLPGNPKPINEHQVKFSPNVVRLDISGPGLPNLSFYDLPGVINVSEIAEEAYLVDLVKNLVKEYIKADDCINLLALPMTDDPANSSASRLIREVKAESRTVGCLTKPDRMQEGESVEQWVQILGGQRFRLGFGYHVIKNNPDVRVNHALARQEEVAFFEDQEPWAVTLNAYAERFGTLNLQTTLSQRLTVQIQTSLPRIISQVQQKAEDIDARLVELPDPLNGNLALNVWTDLLKFERLINAHVGGGLQTNSFQKEWNVTSQKFKLDLAETRPVLVFQHQQTPQRTQLPQTLGGDISGTPSPAARNTLPIAIDSDESDEMYTPTKASPAVPRSGLKRSLTSTNTTSRKAQKTDGARSLQSSPAKVSSKRFTIREVQDTMHDAYQGLPGQVDPKALERMIGLSMAHWQVPLDNFLDRTRQLCQNMVFEQVQETFAKYSETQYYDAIQSICEEFFVKAFSEQRQLAQRILGWEQSNPTTSNDEAFELAQQAALQLLQTKRHKIRAGIFLDEQEAKTGKLSTAQARLEKIAKISESHLGPEPYRSEIKAMSTVKGYYECAYYRFVDVVCASVHCELFAKCRRDIVQAMKDKFDVTGPDAEQRLAILLAANPVQEERRAQLKKEQDTIAKAQERLKGLTGDE